eukprot:scaffold53217_cov71-Phaeocystis_antarctica.AAC.6
MSHSELRTSTRMLPQLRSPCWCMRRGALELLDQAHEGLARVFVAPHSRVAVVDQAVLEFLCVAAPSSKGGVEYPFARSESSAPFGTRKARMSEVMMPRRAPSMSPFGCVARVSERVQVSSARERSGPPAPQSSCITAITSVLTLRSG